jgi:thiol-disulfide isomerase/thioredoxin
VNRKGFVISLFLPVLSLGCGGEPAVDQDVVPVVPTPSVEQSDDYSPVATTIAWAEDTQLVPVTFDEWTRELSAFGGEIVVVDYWATWCVPCRERFPHMLEMAERFAPEGVRFVSLSLDDRDDPQTIDDVTDFLEEQNARIPNYLMDEIIPDAFDQLDLLGIPAVAIYDRDGNLHLKLTGDDPNRQFTEDDVEAAVLSLIEQG